MYSSTTGHSLAAIIYVAPTPNHVHLMLIIRVYLNVEDQIPCACGLRREPNPSEQLFNKANNVDEKTTSGGVKSPQSSAQTALQWTVVVAIKVPKISQPSQESFLIVDSNVAPLWERKPEKCNIPASSLRDNREATASKDNADVSESPDRVLWVQISNSAALHILKIADWQALGRHGFCVAIQLSFRVHEPADRTIGTREGVFSCISHERMVSRDSGIP